MTRILFVSPIVPFPEQRGGMNQRIANLLRAACARGPVQFVGYSTAGPPDDPENSRGIAELRTLCPDAVLVPRDNRWWPEISRDSLLWCLRHYVLARGPFLFRTYDAAALIREVRRLAPAADLIWVERLWIAWHLPELASRIVLDLDDLESVKTARRMRGWRKTPTTLAAWFDWWKLQRAERAARGRFLRTLVCSREDLALWRDMQPGVPSLLEDLWVVPNGFNDHLLQLPLPTVTAPRVIFVGTLHYWPNTEAVLRFTKKILPLIRAKCPTVEFWIVGLGPAQEILDLDDGKAVRVFPDVPEVIDYVREAAVSVVPLRIGGGTRLKILESLAAGVPVVSTTVGVEGIALVPDTHLFVADEPQDFANRVCRLLGDPALREQQVSAARSAIASEYSWSSIRERVGQKLASLASSLSENPATRSQKVDKG